MKGNKVLKATLIVMIITIISRFIGFFRDILAAYHFGVGEKYDIYSAAVAIPESVFMIVGLAISTTFIPMLSEVKHKKDKNEMFRFSNNIITILTILSVIIFIFGIIFTEQIVKVFVSGFTSESIEITVLLTRISLINLIFLCINACFTSILQVCEDFIIPSTIGLFFNLPIIIYLVVFKEVSILGLTVANVLGNILRVLIQLPSLYRQGYKLRFFVDIYDNRIKQMIILIIPVIIGAGANSLNMIVDKSIASGLVSGSISALDYSQKIVVFINVAFTTSIISVMYPLMANKINKGDKDGFLEYLFKSIVVISLLLIPITVGVIFLRKEIISVFYSRGAFGENALILTSAAFFGYALQLPFVGVRDILNSCLFSMKKTKITTINGVVGVIFNILFNLILSKYLGVAGISLATCISAAITSILLFNSTRKLIGNFDVKPMVIKLIKILISSLVMLIILNIVNNVILIKNYFLVILTDGVIGASIFFISCILLKIDEVNDVIIIIKNKLKVRKGIK